MIPAGSTLQFQVAGSTQIGLLSFGLSPDDLQAQVTNALSQSFDVYDFELAHSYIGDLSNLSLWNWSYTVTLWIGTRVDYNSLSDIGSVIAHAFYTVAGAVPAVTSPSGAGQPSTAGGVSGDASTAAQWLGGLGTELQSLLGGLGTGLQQTGTIVVIGLVVIIGLIAFSPTGKGLAKAVRV